MSFSFNELIAEIRKECANCKSDRDLNNAISIIDRTLKNVNVDESFIGEFYKVKKKMQFESVFSTSVLLGLIIGLLSSYAATATNLFNDGEVHVSVSIYNFVLFICLVAMGTAICGIVIRIGLDKYICVLYPYIASKMEDMIARSTFEFNSDSRPKKKNKIIEAVKRFVKRNRLLSILSFIAMSIIISYTLTSHLPEIVPGIGKWYKLMFDLSLGVIVNLIFYLFQVYLPQLEAEKNSLPVITPELVKLIDKMQEIVLVLEYYLPDYKQGKFNILNDTVYYMLKDNADIRRGWSRKFILSNDFLPLIESADKTLDRLLSSIFLPNCDSELIELLGKMKLNGFLKALESAAEDGFDPKCNYSDFKRYQSEFFYLYEKLKGYANGYHKHYIDQLSAEEIEFYTMRVNSAPIKKKVVPYVYIDSTK